MRDDFELTISYPPGEDGDWIEPNLDDQIMDAVGQQSVGSGAGPLTGTRDLHFSFDSRLDAEHAVRRVRETVGSDVQFKWTIVLWGADGGHRTLDMGQNVQSKEVTHEAKN